MVTELRKKEILTVKDMLDTFTSKIDNFKSDMDAIDKKYRELAEAEKKELKQSFAECKSQLKVWQKMFNNFDTTMVKEVLGDAYETNVSVDEPVVEHEVSTTAEVEPAEEAIVDTLFEENNEPTETPVEEEKAGEDIPEETTEESAEEETPATAEEDIWPEETASSVEEPEATETIDIDGDWPEFPQEW